MSITESADLPELREHIRARRAALAGFMEQGASLALDGDLLRVIPRNDIYIRYLNDNRAAIGELASELYGRKLRVEVSLNGATAPPAAGAILVETGGLPAEREHVLTADDKTDFIIAHWKSQLIRKIGEVDARYRPTDEAGLAEALMQFTLGPDAPLEVKRPPELKTLADEEVAGKFADLASRAWGERTLLPASPASGAVVASAGRRVPGLRTVRDYVAEMKTRQERKALIQGLVYEGETVLWVGRAMAGKSTEACDAARCLVTDDDFLGRTVTKARVGYLALERNGHDVARKFLKWGVDEILFTDELPPMQPAALAQFLERQIAEHHLQVLFVDHLQNLVHVADSNDYALVSNALEPFAAVARRTGCALILLHHLPKSPREDGEIDAMGSEAYRGSADCFIESTRSNGRYFIRAEARGGGLLPRMIVTLDRDTGMLSGADAVDAERTDLESRILRHLEAVGHPVPAPELREALGTRARILSEAFDALIKAKKVSRIGAGKKGDPQVYEIRHFPRTGNANDESADGGRIADAEGAQKDSLIRHFPTVGKANDEFGNPQFTQQPQAKMRFPSSGKRIAENDASGKAFQPIAGIANDANDANEERAEAGKEAMPFDGALNDPNGIEWSK